LSSSLVWVRFIIPALAIVVGYGLFVPGELMRRATSSQRGREESVARPACAISVSNFSAPASSTWRSKRTAAARSTATTMDLLYQLGNDFEKRRQTQKASNVYSYIAARDPNYRDLRARRQRLKRSR
jgi:serine/threonine-protein kinase